MPLDFFVAYLPDLSLWVLEAELKRDQVIIRKRVDAVVGRHIVVRQEL